MSKNTLIIIIVILIIAAVAISFFTSIKTNNSFTTIVSDDGTEIEVTTNIEDAIGDDYDFSTNSETIITLNDSNTEISGIGANATTDENGTTITITSGGVYRFTGTLTDGQIMVEASKAKVKIILDNASITSNSSSALYVYKSSYTIVELADNTINTLTDATSYNYDMTNSSSEDKDPNAALYSKSDLIIMGNGTLNINANYSNGIIGKDNLKIVDATINIKAKNNGINGKDSAIIKDATITIDAKGDGLRSTNGTINILSGNITISVGDDAIHAYDSIVIVTGNISIPKSHEGLEADNINIYDGNIDITADDDGINVGVGNTSGDHKLVIKGGNIVVNSDGDGLDSNGDIEMSGGNVIVYGSTRSDNSAIDYDGTFNITGGTLIAVGSYGMAMSPSSSSSQKSVMYNVSSQDAGSEITLKDSNENVIASVISKKAFSNIVVSTPEIEENGDYTLYIDGVETTVNATTGFGNFGGLGGGRQGGMKNQESFNKK